MKQTFLYAVGLCAIAMVARADVLELKDGTVLNGKYVGGTASSIRFETGQSVKVLNTSQVLALTIAGGSVASSAAQPAAASGGAVSVPAGTLLLVRMMDGASSNDSKGKRFTTTLENDLVVGGRMVAKAGTRVYGRVENAQRAGRYVGQSELDLRLTDLSVGGSLVPIRTGSYAQAGANSLRKTGRGAAAGAAIGAIADGGSGAAKGAAIGAVASGVKKGQAIVVPSGTLLEFTIQQPVTVTVGS